jgi:hypothetical protein
LISLVSSFKHLKPKFTLLFKVNRKHKLSRFTRTPFLKLSEVFLRFNDEW